MLSYLFSVPKSPDQVRFAPIFGEKISRYGAFRYFIAEENHAAEGNSSHHGADHHFHAYVRVLKQPCLGMANGLDWRG